MICRGATMDNHVCPQQSKDEEIGEATKTIIRNIPNTPTTEDIDNMTHTEMVKALIHRAHPSIWNKKRAVLRQHFRPPMKYREDM